MCIKCFIDHLTDAGVIREVTLKELRPEPVRIAYDSMLEPTQVKDHELYEVYLVKPNNYIH